MMMANGGASFDWPFEDVVTADDDEDLSMDIDSLLRLLDESQPGDSSQNGLVDPSLSIASCSELASHAGVNEHFQSYNGSHPFSPSHHSEASASRTFCSSGSSDTERQTVNFNFMKVENRPDVSSMHFTSERLGDQAMSVPCLANNGVSRSFPSFSQHDTRETKFERVNSNGTFGFGDGNVYHQLMDKSGITEGICYDSVADTCRKSEPLDYVEAPFIGLSGCYDIAYDINNEFPLPYRTSLNEPSYIAPSRHSQTSDFGPMINNNGMIFNAKTKFEEHLMHSSSLNSEMNYENQNSGFGSYVIAKRNNAWLPSSESSSDTPASESSSGGHLSLKFNRQNKTQMICVKDEKSDAKGLFESFSGVFNSISHKDCVVKGEQEDTKRFLHFTNIIDKSCRSNTPFSDNFRPDLASREQSFIQSDTSTKEQLISRNEERGSKFIACNSMASSPSKITQEAVPNNTLGNVTYIDDDDPDICILEDVSEPARKKQSLVEGNSLVTTQRSVVCPPATHLGFNNARLKTTDERFVYRVALQDLSQPKSEASPPDGALAVPLLRHQRIALSWMVQKETKSLHCFGGILADDQGLGKTISMIALILKERSPSSSVRTIAMKEKTTETLNLDDDDDDVLKLDKSEQNAGSCSVAPNGSSNSYVQTRSRPAAGTLVVCPTSVLRQWNDELHNKVSSKANLSVLVYHGGNRTKDPSELAKYDVVLTTYAIVSMEVPKQPLVDEDDDETKRRGDFETVGLSSSKKRKYPPSSGKSSKKGKMDSELFESLARPLAKVRWFRVILDEAQSIKNHKTQVARACWGLRAKRRWCLSGTPIQNAIDDLYSYFRFLKYDPYAVYKSFCSTIKAPIQRSPKTGYKKLQAVLKTIMLRRTKGSLLDGEPIISLPPKTVDLKKVEFTVDERDFYRRLEADSRAQFEEYAAAGTVKQNYVNILLMLLRLRQACDHPLLVGGSSSKSDWKSSVDKAKKLSEEKRNRLLNCLEASLAICGLCSDPPEDAVVTTCEHVFCNQCILEHLSSDDSHCPSSKCKTLLTKSSVFTKSTLASVSDHPSPDQGSVKAEVLDPCSSNESIDSSKIEAAEALDSSKIKAAEALDSSKIKAALQVLQSIAKPIGNCAEKSSKDLSGFLENGTNVKENSVVREKAIVFSQWTRMLDLLEACLKDSNIGYRRLDGTMSVLARDKAVKDFNSLPEVTVMIMSLKAASLGLNMVAACHVLLLDLWWNPTTEDQAIDRAHRIGQTRPVTVLRLTVKDTVEDRILALQQKKREMVSSAFGEDETGSRQTRLTVDDLKYLFQA